jgi:glycosyltransferase involved in cell wall biosynthesis
MVEHARKGRRIHEAMRILFHHRIASRDGQSVHLEELMKALRTLGHEVILVGPPAFAQAEFGSSNSAVDRIKALIPAWLYEPLEIVYNLKAFLRLRAAVRAHRPDIIYERFSLYLFAGVWVRRLMGLPLILEVNSPLFEERAKNDGLRLHRIGRWAQTTIWRSVDHSFPVTGVLAKTMQDYGVPASRITVVPNGVDPARFPFNPADRKAEPGQRPRIVLGFTGFIRDWNAVHRLIDFAAAHRDAYDIQVLVVGDGPARPFLEEHARTRNVADQLIITGIVGRDDVTWHMARFDIAVLPDVTPYSSPLKLFEYLQLGCAIVAPDMENIREILTEGHDALLFAKAPGALETALLTLCADDALRARLGAAARQTITRKSLTWVNSAERVVAVAQNLLAPAARKGA